MHGPSGREDSMFTFATELQNPVGSPIRELFQYLSVPGMISFAGGYPAASTFDVGNIAQCVSTAIAQAPSECLQYGSTEGVLSLRSALSELMERRGAPTEVDRILITSGSQQAFDFVVRSFVEPGTRVLVEAPTYPAAIQAFRLAGAGIDAIPTDSEGIDTEALEAYLSACPGHARPRLLYLVPAFANPTGAELSLERRNHLLGIIKAYDLILVEDDPYGCLAFDGEALPSMLALSRGNDALRDRIIYLGSLSKTVAPGLRIGWMAAHPDVIRRAVIAKQASDLCTPPWIQVAMAVYLQSGYLDAQVRRIVSAYRVKRDVMVEALSGQLAGGLSFSAPKGGMFVWASLPEGADSAALLRLAIDERVLFVPGKAFYTGTGTHSTLRLSFATPSIEDIETGVGRLATAISRMSVVLEIQP